MLCVLVILGLRLSLLKFIGAGAVPGVYPHPVIFHTFKFFYDYGAYLGTNIDLALDFLGVVRLPY